MSTIANPLLAVSPALSPATVPAAVQAAVHGPYEDLAIAGINLIEKIIDGMTPTQKATVWQQWIDFWAPLMKLGANL